MSIEGDQFNHQLDKFLSDFSEDEQERILRYALDHIVPKLRTCATSQQAEAKVNEPVWFHKNWGEDDDIFYRPNDVIPDGSTPLYTTPQPATASACNIPGMVKTTCPYCEQGFAFEHEHTVTTALA